VKDLTDLDIIFFLVKNLKDDKNTVDECLRANEADMHPVSCVADQARHGTIPRIESTR
ncbi:hypothetical protein Tco_1449482, partial [Tanacetum coccineum]